MQGVFRVRQSRLLQLSLKAMGSFRPGTPSHRGRLVGGTLWSLFGAVVSRGLALLASVFVARLLGKVGFGELGIVQNTVGTFMGFGMGLTAIKYVAEYRLTDPAKAGRVIALSSVVAWTSGLIMCSTLMAIAPWLARICLGAPQLGGVLRTSSILVLLGAVNGAQLGALSGFEAFRTVAKISCISGVLTFPLTLAGVLWFGLDGVVWTMILSQCLSCLLSHRELRAEALRHGIPFACHGCSKEMRVLWAFSVPSVLSDLMFGPVYWLCYLMLVHQPEGYGQMGIFSAANQWCAALLFLPGVLSRVLMPVLTNQMGAANDRNSTETLVFSTKLTCVMVLPLVVVFCLASPFIMGFYGPSFVGTWPILIVVLVTSLLAAVQMPAAKIIAASGKMWIGLLVDVVWSSCFVLGSVWLVHRGAFGLAMARLVACLAHVLVTWVVALRTMETARIKPLPVPQTSVGTL